MSMIGKHVDKFHFPNHVDPWCHKNCNPQDVRHLDGINTPICEQLFSAINKYTNAKAMNEAHFFIFFLYIFDLHNLNIEQKLRSIANPKSEYRYELISKLKNNQVDEVASLMEKVTVTEEGSIVREEESEKEGLEPNIDPAHMNTGSSEQFSCNLCNANYKRAGNLKLHIENKHKDKSAPGLQNTIPKTHRCPQCEIPFSEPKYLNRHIKAQHSPVTCNICEKTFRGKEEHDAHMEEHMSCETCGKTFDKMFKLNRHAKTHK